MKLVPLVSANFLHWLYKSRGYSRNEELPAKSLHKSYFTTVSMQNRTTAIPNLPKTGVILFGTNLWGIFECIYSKLYIKRSLLPIQHVGFYMLSMNHSKSHFATT